MVVFILFGFRFLSTMIELWSEKKYSIDSLFLKKEQISSVQLNYELKQATNFIFLHMQILLFPKKNFVCNDLV